MRKYLSIIKINFISALNKRADFYGQIINNSVQILAAVIIWIVIYTPEQAINGYTLNDTIVYYILVLLITYATYTSSVDVISANIKSGKISEWLLKPRDILLTELSRASGDQLFRVFVLTPVYIVIGIGITLANVGIKFTLEGIILGIFFIYLGFFINCLLEYSLGMIAFWIDEIWSVRHFKLVISELLGGKRIPLAFFPPFILAINNYLPFKFFFFVPLEYFLGKKQASTEFASDLGVTIIWLVLLTMMSVFLYNRGIKKYGAFGN